MSRYDAIPDALVTADLGEGVGVQPVADWSVSRQMSGGGLPGQARGASGMSVGTGSVTVDSPAGRSPWTAGPIRPGGTVALDARADTAAPMSTIARMVARDVSGSASSRALSVTIEDDIERLRGTVVLPRAVPDLLGQGAAPSPNFGFDASWVISYVARAIDFVTDPYPPGRGALLYVPLDGGFVVEVGSARAATPSGPSATTWRWVEGPDGRAVLDLVSSTAGTATVNLDALPELSRGPIYFRCEVDRTSTGTFTVVGMGPFPGVTLDVTPTALTLTSISSSTGPLPPAPASGWSSILVELSTSFFATAYVDGVQVAIVSAGTRTTATSVALRWAPGARVRNISLSTTYYTARTAATADVGWADSRLDAILIDAGRSAWETMQEIARATLGWVGIDADGALVYRGRDALRGGTPTETIVSEDSLEDVPWAISADDVADRVEVTYRPAALLTTAPGSNPTYTVWESTELIGIPPGRPAVVDAQIQGAIGRLAGMWLPVWDATQPIAEWSRWNAFPSPDGSDTTQPPSDALAFDTQLLSSDRVRITITNRTTNPLWVTQLTLRAAMVARAGEPLTVSRGAPADTARSLLTYDLDTWVQDDATAREILDWLAGTTSEPLPTLTGVRVVPNVSRRLGQIVKVVDRTTALAAKALITGISMTGSDGALTQNLDLTILATTFNDVDTWLTREALTTFDLLDARLTALGLDTFDKLDDYLTRLGGIL